MASARHLKSDVRLQPEECAFLAALVRRLQGYGFTKVKAGVGSYANGGDYVFVSGSLDGIAMEALWPLSIGAGLALQSLSAAIDDVGEKIEQQRAEASRG